jgi:hypothetical protein
MASCSPQVNSNFQGFSTQLSSDLSSLISVPASQFVVQSVAADPAGGIDATIWVLAASDSGTDAEVQVRDLHSPASAVAAALPLTDARRALCKLSRTRSAAPRPAGAQPTTCRAERRC